MRRFIKRIVVVFLYISGVNLLYSFLFRNYAYAIGYHSIAKAGAAEFLKYKKVTIEAEVFEEHLKYLIEKGHTFVTFSKLKESLKKGVKKPTAIFFDDGFKNNLTVALPILKKYNIPMTIFITTGYVGGTVKQPQSDEDAPSSNFMLSWSEVLDIKNAGGEIGSHGLTHAKLTECNDIELKKELIESRQEIARLLNSEPTSISYPRGRYNENVVAEAKKAGYDFAVTTIEGINSLNFLESHPLEICRIAPKPYDDFIMFKVKVYSWNLVKKFF